MTGTPSMPNTVNGTDGCGSGGGTGQLASQSTQLQAGTAGWKKNAYSQQETFQSEAFMVTECNEFFSGNESCTYGMNFHTAMANYPRQFPCKQ
jgi:hypothetical protein